MPLKPLTYQKGEKLGIKNPFTGKEAVRTTNTVRQKGDALGVKNPFTGKGAVRTK
jgi:hypothetical protein